VDVIPLGIGGMLAESSGLSYRFSEVFCEIADMAASLLGATENALDVDLRSESDDVSGFGEFLTSVFPRW
jgi:hypothetical protein